MAHAQHTLLPGTRSCDVVAQHAMLLCTVVIIRPLVGRVLSPSAHVATRPPTTGAPTCASFSSSSSCEGPWEGAGLLHLRQAGTASVRVLNLYGPQWTV